MFSKHFGFRRKSDREDLPRQPNNHASAPLADQGDEAPSMRSHSLSYIKTPSQLSVRRKNDIDIGPLGLNVIYTPDNGHKADIIFVHGLGGSSHITWSKHKNPELFWPLTFLPLEPDICLARILSFGYNADFAKAGEASTVVLDFAKDLLYDLKYSTDHRKEILNIGQVPLIFVVHSMGGLIVKEAYMQGQNDPEYEEIVKAISSIIFLATPHRGTNLAAVLNRILQSTPITHSKQYVSELTRNSFTLQKLNEQFRHIAPKLQIVSFYETRPTPIGIKNARVMVLEKDTSLLGYPGEISRALDADHNGVCKYENPRDPNYIVVRNILKSLVSKIIPTKQSTRPGVSNRTMSRNLKAMLAVSETPDIDYVFFRDQWTQGTNDWILGEKAFIDWLNSQASVPHVLWLKGGAATGKSVLCSFIINNLVERGLCCQYFFIRFGDRRKRTLSLILRSIAYQIAQHLPKFLHKVTELEDEAIDFEAADPKTIWERIFKSVLFKLEENRTLYWVIDGLDEANDMRATVKLLSDINMSSIPIRVLIASRETSEITTGLEKIPKTIRREVIKIEGKLEDLNHYIRQELSLSGTVEFRESVVQRIVEGAQNNFLWVRLAVERINACHTHSAIERALKEFPPGMEAIYDRMASSIVKHHPSLDGSLASAVLQHVTCSFRVLTVAELSQALEDDVSDLLDLQESIRKVCGGFIVIDINGNVAMIHQTAREYLLGDLDRPFHVDQHSAHEQLFLSCMRCLMSTGLRAKVDQGATEFLNYSATWWSSHLASIPPHYEKVARLLSKFLAGPCVLTWIQILATENRLRVLVQASKHLSEYARRRKAQAAAWTEKHQLVDQEFMETWAVDLVKIVGKFGNTLRRNPASIYKLIPPFCPHESAIYQQFGKTEARNIMVTGFSTQIWDDSLARLSFGFGIYASSISAAGAQIAVLASSGNISVYDSSVFEEVAASPIAHGERVYRMKLSNSGTLLVTYGFKTTKVWETPTGRCKLTIENVNSRPRPLVMLLTNNNDTLLVGTDDRQLRSVTLSKTSPTWQLVSKFEEEELEGHFLNAASYMALNNDGTLMAVAYRGHPLSAWEVDGPVHISHCWRAREELARGEVIEAVWHPHSPVVLGLYIEGVVFKWNPYCGDPEEIGTGASRLAISGDGNLFATGDVHGTIKVYTTSGFRLLYQLSTQDTVLGLAFSPDQHRLYDVRGYYGNAWEPTALMRYAERSGKATDSESETESLTQWSTTSVSSPRRVDSVTVLAASPAGWLYCCGTEYGRVRLFDTQKGEPRELHASKSFLSIEQLIWNDDGRYLCFADSSKKVFIMSINKTTADAHTVAEAQCEISLKNHTEGPILQLLFHPDSSHLFVSTASTICTISLESASIQHSAALRSDEYKWMAHPQDLSLILGFGPDSVKLLDWSLTERMNYVIKHTPEQVAQYDFESAKASRAIDRVLLTHDKRHILVQMSLGRSFKEKIFLYFTTSSVSAGAPTASDAQNITDWVEIHPTLLPRQLTSQINLALAFLTKDRLLFLSRNFSICSWSITSHSSQYLASQLPSPANSDSIASITSSDSALLNRQRSDTAGGPAKKVLNEIFALPGDWISKDCLDLCRVWLRERSLLCPRNGEVAVVRCAGFV